MAKVDTFKAVKEVFKAKGGFKAGNGNWMFTDTEESLIYMLNTKEGLVKAYTIGNGGVNWLDSIKVEDFIKDYK